MKSAQFTPFLDLNPSCPKEVLEVPVALCWIYSFGVRYYVILYMSICIYICDTCDCIEQPFQSNKHRGFTYIVKYIYSMYMLYIYTYIPAVVHHSYIYIYTYALYDWLFIFTIQTISRSEDFISYVAPQIITVLVIGSALSILTGTLNQIHQVGPKCVKWDSKNDHAMTHYRDINSQYV